MKQSDKLKTRSILFLVGALLAGILALRGAPAALAAGIVVNSTADTVANDGQCTLREAIIAANTDTASGAAAGECTAGSGADTITFDANYTITLVGSQLPVVTSEITITGNGAANTIIQANAAANTATYRILEVDGSGNLTLNGVAVRHGLCAGACSNSAAITDGERNGGGILLRQGTLRVNNSTISDNTASLGGGILNYFGTLNVTNSTLSDNTATSSGGGIRNEGTLTVTDSTLTGNTASSSGGGISSFGGTLTVTNSTLSSNTSTFDGGGISNFFSTLTVTGSTLSGNSSGAGGAIISAGTANVTGSTLSGNTVGGDGGGILHTRGMLTVTNSTLSDNTAWQQGGGIFAVGATGPSVANVTNSTISGNTVAIFGGGIYIDRVELTLANSTVSGNTAINGGGIFSFGDFGPTVANVTNSTISGNTASNGGAGIYNNGPSATTTVTNSIVSGNTGTNTTDELLNSNGTLTGSHNVLGDSSKTSAQAFEGFTPDASDITATSDEQNVALASILSTTLANNGGPTQTLALVASSPAIDLAPSAGCATAPVNGVDQRGYSRNINGDGAASTNECDAGAFEYLSTTPPLVCEAGSYFNGTECVPADPGYYVPTAGAIFQIACTEGTYQPNSGATECLLAQPGYFVAIAASTTQTACPVGTYQPSSGASNCIAADPGNFVATPGAAAQTQCAAGTYQPSSGETSCLPAEPGFYVPNSGATEQLQCPQGTTSEAGATECTAIPLATLTITKATDPVGGTGFPFTIDPAAYNFDFSVGTAGSAAGQLDEPWGVAVDAAGNFYVADARNNRIQKFDSSGNFQFAFGWDVVDGGGTGFEICTPSDTCQAGSAGNGDGQFNGPFGVAVDTLGNIYVAENFGNRIQKFNSSGAFVTKWGTSGIAEGQFSSPYDVAVDAAGNVYVADFGNDRIQKFDSNGAFLLMWGWGVADSSSIFQICTSGCRRGIDGFGDGQLNSPTGVAVDTAGNVFVANRSSDRIQKFESSGGFVHKWGSRGSNNGQFNFPYDVAVDPAGNVFVADSLNNRIQKFDSNRGFLTKWGANGSGDGQFNFPYGVAVDVAGKVVVADTLNDRIQVFSPDLSTTLDDGQSDTFTDLEPGDYLISELAPGGWIVDNISCDGGSPTYNELSAALSLAAGDDVTCTFSNTQCQPGTFDNGSNVCVPAPAGSFVSQPGATSATECAPGSWQDQTGADSCKLADPGFYVPGSGATEQLQCPQGTTSEAGATECTAIPLASACPVDEPAAGTVGTELTTLLGSGMGSPARSKMVAKVVIPNAANLTDLYGQMAAKEFSGVRYVRFYYPTKADGTIQVQPETDLGERGAISWWGTTMDESLIAPKGFIRGRWFLNKGAQKMKLPRAIVVYATHETSSQYANAWQTFNAPSNFVAHTSGFDQSNTNVLPIPETQAATDIVVQIAITDVNNDPRTVDVIVTAGNVSETTTLVGPINKKSELLNLLEVTLEDVPAGVDNVEIELVSALDEGDSAALLGAAAHYACALPVP